VLGCLSHHPPRILPHLRTFQSTLGRIIQPLFCALTRRRDFFFNRRAARSRSSFVWRCLSGSTVTPFPHRLRLAEIRDRLGAAVQCFIGEAAVVVGLDIGRIELDRLREICNRVVAVALCDVRDVSKAVLFVDRRVFASMRSIVASRDRPSRGSNSEEHGEAASPLAKPKPLFALPTQSGKHVQPPPA
jgi:hypothetical protein